MKENPETLFEKFLKASTCKATLQTFRLLCKDLHVQYPPERTTTYEHITFYTRLKKALGTYWKAQSLFSKLDKKYNGEVNFADRKSSTDGKNKVAKDMNVLIVGAGPCGLRVAIYTALLGAKSIVVEKRDSFSRNNVLHLWPFTIEDLKALGAKKFNGRFCSGAIDHVSIRQLQLILMKAALIFGVEIHLNTAYVDLVPPNLEGMTGWRAKFEPESSPIHDFDFHTIIGADGRKNTLKGFEKKEFRGSLAIGITVNFINKHTTAETKVQEISGINFIYRQDWFRELNMKYNIDLENIVYYKDDTHYFVMTARKQSLVERGVLIECLDDPKQLVHSNNIDQRALLEFALDAVNFSTENKLPDLEVAINNYGLPDIALFDFTCMKSSVNASMFHEVNGVKLLKALVGDGLMEPFWPKGTGIAKGFLAASDTAWMLKRWALGKLQDKSGNNSLEMSLLAERESLYRVLAQTESNNLAQNHSLYTIDPKTRYQFQPRKLTPGQVRHFYVTDGKDVAPMPETEIDGLAPSRLVRNASFCRSNKLQQWCQRVLRESGSTIVVMNMSSSWKDGCALCAIINYFRPDILGLDQVQPGNVELNNQLAFDAAEEHLGITPIMSGKEMAECETVDHLVMVTYISQFYEILKTEMPVKPIKRVSDVVPTPPEDSLPEMNKKKLSSSGLFGRISKTFRRKQRGSSKEYDLDTRDTKRRKMKQDTGVAYSDSKDVVVTKAVLPTIPDEDDKENTVVMRSSITPGVRKTATNRISALGQQLISQLEQNSDVPVQKPTKQLAVKKSSSNVCYFCDKTVYIVERLSVEGLFFHRQCFKCSHCETILRPMNYKRDCDSGRFYCAVHYFANAEYLKQGKRDDAEANSRNLSSEVRVDDSANDVANYESGDGFSPSTSRVKSPSFSDHNLSVHTIEHGQVVVRRDLTPKRADMEEFSLSIASNQIEIGEEVLNEHNMRCSRTSDSDDESDSESENDELQEHNMEMNVPVPEDSAEAYGKKRHSNVSEMSDSIFLSSESEGDDDAGSISSTSADDTVQVMKTSVRNSAPENEPSNTEAVELENDNLSLSTASTDSEQEVQDGGRKHSGDFLEIASAGDSGRGIRQKERDTLKNVERYLEEHPFDAKRSSMSMSSSDDDEILDYQKLNATDGEKLPVESPSVPRKNTVETTKGSIATNPIEKARKLSSSSSDDEKDYEEEKKQEDVVMSSESSDGGADEEQVSIGTDFRTSKNDSSVWVTKSEEVAEKMDPKFDTIDGAVVENSVNETQQDAECLHEQKESVVVETEETDGKVSDVVMPVVASTPKLTSFLHSDSEVFQTPCGGHSELDDTFYTVNSEQPSSRDISSYISPSDMDTTISSETSEDVVVPEETSSTMFSSQSRSASGRTLPETPKPPPPGRRLLPVIPHLEALSPTTSETSLQQRNRIEMKLKRHEVRVMQRIQEMKIGAGANAAAKSDKWPSNGTRDSSEQHAPEHDDFADHVPALIRKKNLALKKKKLKPGVNVSERRKGLFHFSNNKKAKKEKRDATPPVPAKVMSPTHRSSRRRELSPHTKEELDNKVLLRARYAAQRQAKEAERKRMARAMVIQGQLQEVDAKRKQLEERGVELEKLLRNQASASARPRDSSIHMHEWFKLVQEKNALLRYENELMIYQRELQLEDRQSRLQQDLRERMAVPDSKKTPEDLTREKEVLAEMLSTVEQRDELVALLDEHKTQDQEENSDIQHVLTDKFTSKQSSSSKFFSPL